MGREELVAQVTDYLRTRLGRSSVDLQRVAKVHGVGVRTLQRRLREEGVTFRQLVRRVRREQLQALLAQGAHADEVAEGVGYCDGRSVRRFLSQARG